MRSRLRHTGTGLLVLGALIIAGCQGEGSDPAPATETAPTGPATDDAAATTAESSPTTAAAAETAGSEEDRATTAPAAAPTAEAVPTTAEDEGGPGGEDEEAPSDVIEISDFTAFTTPAQAAYCLISGPGDGMGASISCEVMQSSVPPGEELMGVCDPEGFGWFFNFFEDTGHAGFYCNHIDGITRGGGNPHYWRDDPWINPESVAVLENGTRVAILDYGRVMRAGGMACSVQPDGLTCNNPDTGHGFTVNSASYVSW